jgi:sulfide:quinone oxidoreductase
MLNTKMIVPGFSATTQLTVADMELVKSGGFRSVLNNRPDNEEEGQPLSDDLQREAQRLRLEYLHVPATLAPLTEDELTEFVVALKALPEPVLGFCRSGTRAARMWAQAKVGDYRSAELIELAAAAGFDISDLEEHLSQLR